MTTDMASGVLALAALKCEYLVNPLGIDSQSPRLSWQLCAEGRGQRQTAYQVLVASSAELLAKETGDLWDSGKVLSDQSIHIAYAGTALRSNIRCFWKVRVWDRDGRPSPYSEPASWSMGIMQEGDWQAQWIVPAVQPKEQLAELAPPSPIFRKEITLDKPVQSAQVHISGLGYYELRINGERVGDHVLDPLFTRYDQRTLYVTHDVTTLLQSGANAIGVMLGNGWYNCFTAEVWNFREAPWRDNPKLLFQLHITYTDGNTETMVSDLSWKASTGPVVFDGLRNGETYDARQEKPGWDLPGYNDADWTPSMVIPGPGGKLNAQRLPIRVMQTVAPLSVKEVKPGVFVFDLGQNLTGWAQLTVSGPAGTEITLRYAEKLLDDGEVDQSNINCFIKSGDTQTDRYILNGNGVEVWEPHFTYHGFQYVQVTGFPGTPTVDNLRARVVHSAFETTGEFACSNELLNRIQECTRWSYISNFVGIPTDCPHREKNGWTGDAQIAAETGLFNYAAAPAYAKWMDDFSDAVRPSGQLPGIVPTGGWGYNWGSGPAWDSAYVNIPWYLYLYCGDLRILEMHYEKMKQYLGFMARMATDDILYFGLGDWCPPEDGPSGHLAPEKLTSTGYYYSNACVVARIAALLGKAEDTEYYTALAARIKQAFNRDFYEGDGYYTGRGTTSMGTALYQGMVAESEREKVLSALIDTVRKNDNHPDFGILGAKYVPNTLTEHGRTDVAYALATQTTFPSWGYWLAQGATTLWESWAGDSSRNHIMFGDISAWMYKALAGINPDPAQPGFKHVIIRPNPVADLTWAQATHESPYGTVRSEWARTDGTFTLKVIIPANTTATVYLPAISVDQVSEGNTPAVNAEGVVFQRTEAGRVVVEVESGSYHFTVKG